MANFLNKIYYFIATGIYSGCAPKAPGTAGTLAAAVILAILIAFGTAPSWSPLVLAVVLTIAGWHATAVLLKKDGSFSQPSDPPEVVIDEFAGFYVALIGLELNAFNLVAAFVLFRLFDITKIPPISHAERLPGATGIMADDIIAGIFANISLRIILALM
jgi:phosphatidylglycerophosphatase A